MISVHEDLITKEIAGLSQMDVATEEKK